jgi:DNA-binding transcriptional MerR regulator
MKTQTCTTAQAARRIGVSRQTLQTWIARGWIVPPKPLQIAGATVRLWSSREIEAARRFKGTLKPGRKPESPKK